MLYVLILYIKGGTYKLTIQNIIKKDFEFLSGGSIAFGGDPYNAIQSSIGSGVDHRKKRPQSTYRRCRFWYKKIIFSVEAHFDLGGYVNKQNCRIWATKNPHAHEKPKHSKRVTVCCGLWSRGIIWPFFFENDLRSMAIVIAIRIFVHKN